VGITVEVKWGREEIMEDEMEGTTEDGVDEADTFVLHNRISICLQHTKYLAQVVMYQDHHSTIHTMLKLRMYHLDFRLHRPPPPPLHWNYPQWHIDTHSLSEWRWSSPECGGEETRDDGGMRAKDSECVSLCPFFCVFFCFVY
jgi:hypothetical protein